MVGIFIGIILSIGFILFLRLIKKKQLHLKWWQWTIITFWFLYCAFILKMIEAFVAEHALKAALVMGLIFGFIAVVWGVLFIRLFILKYQKSNGQN